MSPGWGTTVLNGPQGYGVYLTYQPNSLFNGVDLFTYTITDHFGASSTGTVVVVVTPVVYVAPNPNQSGQQDLVIPLL